MCPLGIIVFLNPFPSHPYPLKINVYHSIDAWVICTALAHEYHYEQPPDGANDTIMRQEREDYVEWKRSTQRGCIDTSRWKELLNSMIELGHSICRGIMLLQR